MGNEKSLRAAGFSLSVPTQKVICLCEERSDEAIPPTLSLTLEGGVGRGEIALPFGLAMTCEIA